MKFLLALLSVVSFAVSAFAQDSSTQITMPTVEPVEERPVFASEMPYKVFLNGLPVPVISGGMGGALEFAFARQFSVWGGLEREVASTQGPLNVTLSKETKVTATNSMVGGRFYFKEANVTGFYLNAGYKWSSIYLEHDPGLFMGTRATNRLEAEGPMAGLGFRIQAKQNSSFQWLVDLGVNYEPGEVSNIRYGGEFSFVNLQAESNVTANVANGFFPEARIGAQF